MRRAIALLLVAFLLSACGNKGPLYLPGPDGEDPRQASRTR
jgi:predicted small lipoprotein YifL